MKCYNTRLVRLFTLRNWTLTNSHCFYFYIFLSVMFWSLADWQVWAFTLIKVIGSLKTAKFISKVDVCQNDWLLHTHQNTHTDLFLLFHQCDSGLFFTLKQKFTGGQDVSRDHKLLTVAPKLIQWYHVICCRWYWNPKVKLYKVARNVIKMFCF